MQVKLHVWRQSGPDAPGAMETYDAHDISEEMSFLEMLDIVNERLNAEGREPIAFEHDCREGICGSCGMIVNGSAHGPKKLTTVCQLHMRNFTHGDVIHVEPWRARAFPVIKDLVVNRSSFDRIVQKGGFISTNSGSAPDANAVPIAKTAAETAMDAAACIGCGACVAACPNASAMLFVAAKIAHLGRLPQGAPEKDRRVVGMVDQMDAEGFGNCTNHYECMEACPKGIDVKFIAEMNRAYAKAGVSRTDERSDAGAG